MEDKILNRSPFTFVNVNDVKSILDVEVSCFANYRESKNPRPVSLLTWLTSQKYRKRVEEIRNINDKAERDKLKASLPAITPSGIFTHRSEAGLLKHSGFIQFDIDLKDNEDITNYNSLKEQIRRINNVAYCGLSVSGLGYWGLVPIAHPEKHKSHFKALKTDFERFKIFIDEKPKNISSLRGYSFDSEAYFNHNATTYYRFIDNEPIIKKEPVKKSYITDESQKVEKLITEIKSRNIDITGSYQNWFEIGCSFANEFGEAGRTYYHDVCEQYAGYSAKETDRQYNNCLKNNYNYTIASFYHHCKQAGIFLDQELPKDQPRPDKTNKKKVLLPPGWHYETWTNIYNVEVTNLINAYGYPASLDPPKTKYETLALMDEKNPAVSILFERFDLTLS